jgi:hypothetical protein
MPKKNAKEKTVEQLTLPLEESVALARLNNEVLIEEIRRSPQHYSDATLAPLYSSIHTLHDRLGKFMEVLKKEFKLRRQSWALAGDQNQHRMLLVPTDAGPVEIECQTREKLTLNQARAEALLKEKNAYQDACDLVIETGGEELQKFLKKHYREVSKMGLTLREVLNEDKIAALVERGVLTAAEFRSLLDTGDPTYAILLKTALDLKRLEKVKI